MYAIAFDMVISDLQKYYGEPYNKAYYEIKEPSKEEWFRVGARQYIHDDE